MTDKLRRLPDHHSLYQRACTNFFHSPENINSPEKSVVNGVLGLVDGGKNHGQIVNNFKKLFSYPSRTLLRLFPNLTPNDLRGFETAIISLSKTNPAEYLPEVFE